MALRTHQPLRGGSSQLRGGLLLGGRSKRHDALAVGLSSPGQSLEPGTRAEMERSLGHDFSRVKIHSGHEAALAASLLHAQAFTHRSDIFFSNGRFLPGTSEGRALLRHELAHVKQHDRQGLPPGGSVFPPVLHDSALESEADAWEFSEARAHPLPQGPTRGIGPHPALLLKAEKSPPGGELDDFLDAISTKYEHRYDIQFSAIQKVCEGAQEVVSSLKLIEEFAISAVSTGIAALVVAATEGAAAAEASMIATFMEAVLEDIVAEVIKKTATANLGVSDSKMSKNRFFDALEAGFTAAAHKAADTFNTKGRKKFREISDPAKAIATAEAYFNAMVSVEESGQIAYEQESAALSAWLNHLAQQKFQRSSRGTELKLGKSAAGILRLEIEKPAGKEKVEVISARLDGIDSDLRQDVEARKIETLGISIMVEGEVDRPGIVDPSFWDPDAPRTRIRFGENEKGILFDDSNSLGRRWLYYYGIGGPVYSMPGAMTKAVIDDGRFKGIAKILQQEIGPKSLREFGVELKGS